MAGFSYGGSVTVQPGVKSGERVHYQVEDLQATVGTIVIRHQLSRNRSMPYVLIKT